LNLSRRQNIAITRIRIGHMSLTHSFLISKDQPPICNTCQTRITIRHIFEECPIQYMNQLAHSSTSLSTSKKPSMKNLLKKSSNSSPKTNLLIKYRLSPLKIVNLLKQPLIKYVNLTYNYCNLI